MSLRLLGLLCLAVVSGCTVGPVYRPPAPALPATWSAAEDSGVSTEPAPLAQWWSAFQDAQLTTLIRRAAEANLDVRLAVARVREIRAARGMVTAERQPQVTTSGLYSHNRSSTNAVPMPTRDSDLFQFGFDARWELDIFGGVRRAVEAAEADIEAAMAERQAMLVSLAGEVARHYLELRGAQAQLAITRANLAAQQETMALAQVRFQAGLSSALDVVRAAALVATTQAQLPTLEIQLRQGMHHLAVLLGQEPGALDTELSVAAPIPPPPLVVAVGLPAALLQRRPDIRRAERELAAATARIGVATAERYPRLTLSGTIGHHSLHITDLFLPGSQFWSLGPSLRWPLFDVGRIRATLQVHDARQEQALVRYEKALLTALEDVENALVAYGQEQARQRALATAVEANRHAVAMATELYTKGLADFLNVLEAQRALLAAESQWVHSTTALSAQVVALYKALGGGWEPEEDAPRFRAAVR